MGQFKPFLGVNFIGFSNNITIIEIGSTMTKMMAVRLFEAGSDESAQLMRSIESIEIVAENSPGKSHITGEMFALPDKCQNYELITSIEKSGGITKFYFASHPRSKNREFLMLMRSSEQRIVLYITGSFSISDISALSSLGSEINMQ
ncbi:MAG: DUF4252 domain-containing protein [Rikenellaceae bacterium]